MTVTTSTQRTVIDWTSFSVATDHQLTFKQPDATSIAVNRVVGSDPSKIFGTISSNGRVVIANPNGIWFGASARVDVAGVVASAGRISDQAVGTFVSGGSLAIGAGNASATLINDGLISVREGGFAALVAPGVRNAGTITGRLGRVTLASGATTTVDFYGDGLINVAVGGSTSAAPLDSAVTNSGRIYAEGGQVRLSASVAEGLLNNVINMSGVIEARGVSTAGGVVELLGGSGSIDISGRVDVTGAANHAGGQITVRAGDATAGDGVLNLTGTLDAGSAGGSGGTIDAAARFAYLGGTARADGATGGRVTVNAVGITQSGSVSANGVGSAGGAVTLAAVQNVTQTTSAVTRASSSGGAGGTVTVRAGTSGRVFSSGTLSATGASGGSVQILANDIALAAATVDASATAGRGGAVLVGGDLHGTGDQTAATTLVNGATTLRADGGSQGDGGRIVVWSGTRTDYQGSATARGGAAAGNGGLIEVSSSNLLTFGGTGIASAAKGKAGSLLLDPKNIVIAETTGGLAVFDLLDPNAGTGTDFGDTTAQLANGRVVITKPGDTVGGAANAGSVYTYDSYTGALLSTFQGTHAGDKVGAGQGATTGLLFLDPNATSDPMSGIPIYDNSKAYLIRSPNWNANRGAVTWVAANGMASGILSNANSLVGSSANDRVGSGEYVYIPTIDLLSSGNVLVRSAYWGDGRGALTYIDAATGVTGDVSAANSLVGTLTATANGHGLRGDSLGSDGITTLANGDVIVRSSLWSRGGGALTYVSATTGITGTGATGTLGAGNSLVGNGGVTYSATNQYASGGPALVYGFYGGDNVGSSGITQLANGNVLVLSPSWGHGRGAVTYASAATGFTGTVSAANSLVGAVKGIGDTSDGTDTYFTDTYGQRGWYGGDAVGSGGAVELANHGFVIASPNWSSNKGAATFYDSGTTGLSGTISASTSLTGTTAGSSSGYDGFHRQSIGGGDMVGAVTALDNGNYVVSSSSWNGLRGAVTVMDGTTGFAVVGGNASRGDTVSASNSLVGGTGGDRIGQGIVKLTGTSDFVVQSVEWQSGKGAVTRVSGTAGLAETVSASNSLVGSTSYEQGSLGADNVGSRITALPGGGYVVTSSRWNKIRGAVTFVAAGSNVTGAVSSANSLVGDIGSEGNAIYCTSCNNGQPAMFGGDAIGSGGIQVLQNGNFLILSPDWHSQRGALTFVDGTTGAMVGGAASLSGSIANTNSVVGTVASTRYVSAYNAYGINTTGVRYWVGGDRVGSSTIELLGTDRFLLLNSEWANRKGAVTLARTDGTFASGGSFAGTITAANSLIGSTSSTLNTPTNTTTGNYALNSDGDQIGSESYSVLNDGRIMLFSSKWSAQRGAITLMSGTNGVQGVVSASNSAIGTLAGDQIGNYGFYGLYQQADGSTLILNPYWNGNTGAVTRIAAGASFTGEITAANSMVGGSAGDYFGGTNIVQLPDNRFIINSASVNEGQGAVTYIDGSGPLTGTMNPTNTFYGDAAIPTYNALGYKLAATGSLLMNFSHEGSGRVTLGFTDPTGWTYARAPGSTLTIAPSLLAKSLNNGTSLVLQASNDITINDSIVTAANATGNLTLEAGRSIIANANIGLGAGNLTLLANASLAGGVLDAQRDAGAATINLSGGMLSTTGTVQATLAASNDKTYNDAGGITLGAIAAGTLDVRNLGSDGGALTLDGAITTTASGTSILLATGGAFVNNAGASALNPGAGRFLVYSADPRNNLLGGLTAGGKFYGRTLTDNPPSSLAATGNLFLYSVVPVLTVTGNTTVGYGDSAGSVTPAITGFIDGDTLASATTGSAATSTSYQAGDAVGGSYALTIGQGTLASQLGYAFNLVDGTVTVTPKVLTLALNGSVSKQYDRTNAATLGTGNYQLTGLYGSDTIAISKTTGAYGSANVGTNLNVTVSLSASDFAAGSGTLLSNYVLPTGVSATIGTISARPVTLSGLVAASRTYDGTTTATVTGGALSGVLSGDSVGFTAGGGSFADRNVGTGKAVTLTGYTLTGTAASNYVLSQPAGLSADITAKSVTLSGVTAQNRAYDGTTAIGLSGGTLAGLIGSDAVAIAAGTGSVGSKNVGTQSVSVTGFGLTGADAGNYVLAGQPTGLSATITPLSVLLSGVSAQNRAYDGTTVVALTGGTVSGLLASDAVSLVQGSGSMADRNVGTGKAVSVSGFGLSGADAGNYTLGGVPTSLTVDIAAKALTVSGLTAQGRTYDGTTNVALAGGSLSGVIGSDAVAMSAGSGTLADKNVGTGKAVSLTGFGLSGADAGNYVIAAQPVGLTVDITAKSVTLSGVTAQNRAYDGTTAIGLSGGTLAGLIGSDAVAIAAGTGSVGSKNVGTQSVSVTGFGLTGADAGNYVLAGQPTGLSATITPLSVLLSGVSAQNRAYDGTTVVALTGGTVSGLLASDAVSLVQGSGSMADRNVGTGKAVSVSGFGLSGADAGNYALGGVPTSLTVDIAAKALTVSGLTAQGRTYDGTTNVALAGGSLSGVIGSDAVAMSAGSGTLADKNVGTGKAVSLTGFGLSGADAGNYVIAAQPVGLTVDITAKSVTLSGVTAQNRAYDGTTAIGLSGGTLAGLIGSDAVAIAAGTGSVGSKNVGTQSVSVTGFGLTGADAGNYVLAGQPTGLSATITPLSVLLSGVSAQNRAYDGTTVVALTGGTVSGLLASDAVSLVQGSGSMADRNVGTGKAVSVSGFGLSGADAGNYTLGGVPTSLTVDIAAKALNLSGVTAQSRAYDGTTNVALSGGALSGIVSGDAVTLVNGTGTLADRNIGLGKVVAVSGFGINGVDAGNYVLTGQPTTLTADIAARLVTLDGVTARDRAYDGTTQVALTGGTLSGIVAGDAVSIAMGTASVASKNVGTQSVATSGFGLLGADAGNYALAGQPSGLSVTIDPAKLSVSLIPGSISKTYDGSASAALASTAYQVLGVVPGESIGITKSNGSFAAANAGTALAVTVSLSASDYVAGAGTSLANYALPTGSVTSAAGTILPAALLVRADDKSFRSGNALPALTASYAGLAGNDTAASIGLSPVLTSPAVVQSPPGSYAINVTGGQLTNYTVTYQAGTMTVTPAPVPVPLQALVTNQPVQAVIAAPVSSQSRDGQAAIVTGLATAFVPLPPAVPLVVGRADSALPTSEQGARGAHDYANSFLSSIKLESRK